MPWLASRSNGVSSPGLFKGAHYRKCAWLDPATDESQLAHELLINVVAWISVPNESRDLYKKLTASSEPWIPKPQLKRQ